MISVLLRLAAIGIYQISVTHPSTTTLNPIANHGCSDLNEFISSTPFQNNKFFLLPFSSTERKSDWYQNRRYCAKHCAEMVTIDSEEENTFFVEFMQSVGMIHPGDRGAWLGAQIVKQYDLRQWNNGKKVKYSQEIRKHSEDSFGCLSVDWENDKNWWKSMSCNNGEYFTVCQRNIAPKITTTKGDRIDLITEENLTRKLSTTGLPTEESASTETATSESSTTHLSSTESSTTESSSTKSSTAVSSTTESSTAESSTTESSITELSTTELSNTESSTTKLSRETTSISSEISGIICSLSQVNISEAVFRAGGNNIFQINIKDQFGDVSSFYFDFKNSPGKINFGTFPGTDTKTEMHVSDETFMKIFNNELHGLTAFFQGSLQLDSVFDAIYLLRLKAALSQIEYENGAEKLQSLTHLC